jgi:single-strand DNA-binding protein
MASVNKVILIGNVGKDPEVKFLPDGTAVANISVATTEKFKDREGNTKESVEWHKISFFGRIAEVCQQYLKKGSSVYIEGSIKTRKYQDKETGADRYVTEIKGTNMTMLGGKFDSENNSESNEFDSIPPSSLVAKKQNQQQSKAPAPVVDDVEDIPF